MYPVVTERLELRPFVESDLDGLYDMQRRPEVARYLFWEARSREETRVALAAKLAVTTLTAEGDHLCLAVVHRESGRLVGDFQLEWLSGGHHRAEIGFVTNPDHAGHGYATEAGREMLRLGFEVYGFHRIVGLCDGKNTPSMRLMARLGMRREAYFVQSEMFKGEWTDLAVYAMLRDEWLRG